MADRMFCTILSANVSHNYSDIGFIKIYAYITLAGAHNWTQLQMINSGALTVLMWFNFKRHRTKPALTENLFHSIRVVRFIATTQSPRYSRKSVFKNQFLLNGCLNNKPVELGILENDVEDLSWSWSWVESRLGTNTLHPVPDQFQSPPPPPPRLRPSLVI